MIGLQMRANVQNRIFASCLTVLVSGIVSSIPTLSALADERGHHEFREHDTHRFSRNELKLWRVGGWRHESHFGRVGWWWVIGGVWYLYEKPIYPYPLIVSQVSFAEPVLVAPPSAGVIAPGTPMVAPPPSGPAVVPQALPPQQQPQIWYYCDNPAGYYPYVATCLTPFRPVAAKPQ